MTTSTSFKKLFLSIVIIVFSYNYITAQELLPLLKKAEQAEANQNYKKAKSIYFNMLSSSSDKMDTTMAYAYQNLGHLYMFESKRDSTLHYFEEGFKYYQKHNNAFRMRFFLVSAASACSFWKDYKLHEQYIKRAIQIEGPIEEQYVSIQGQLASIHTRNGQLDSAEILLQRNLILVDSLNIGSSITWQMLGHLEQKRGNYPNAISHLTKAIETYQSEPKLDRSPLFISITYQTISRLFLQLNNFEKTHEMLDKSLQIANANNFKGRKRNLLRERGIAYLETEVDSALFYLKQFKEALSKDGKPIDHFSANNFLALAYLKKSNFKVANEHLKNSQKLIDQIVKEDQKVIYYRAKGSLYIQQRNYELGISNLYKALELAKKTKYEKTQIQVLGLLQNAYAKSGDITKAYELQKEYLQRKEGLSNLQSKQIIYEMEGKFQKAQKDLEITSLTLSNQEKDQSIKSRNQILYSVLLGLIGISLLGWQSYRLYRNKKKSHLLLEEKNQIISKSLSEKELLLKEIHHRVKNNLQVVSSLLSLQSDYIKDDTALNALNEGRNRVKSMALIHQNLYQEENLTGIKAKTYFTKLVSSLFTSYNISEDRISLELNVDDIIVDIDTIVPLGLIANELISNALKYAYPKEESGSIAVSLTQQGNQLFLSVSDKGKGFDTDIIDENISSFGYQMIQAFCNKLNAQMTISNDHGTKAVIRLTV